MIRQRSFPAASSLFVLLAALAGGAGRGAAQQPVSAIVTVALPSPYLASWQTNLAVALLAVQNTTGGSVSATVTAVLHQGRGFLIGTASSDITTLSSGTVNYFTPQIARWGEMQFEPGAVADAVKKTGRLPEGQYTLCIEFTNMSSAAGGPIADVTACANFVVTFPQPPKLLLPLDQSDVVTAYPTLQWTPVVTPGAPQVDYVLRLVEILPSQTPLQAIQGNVPILDQRLTSTTTLVYPPSALPLENGKRYAWRVQAVLGSQFADIGIAIPVGANDGKSEIYTFTKKAGGVVVVQQPPPAPPPPPPGAKPPAQPVMPYWNASLSGKLDYSFSTGDVPTPKHVALTFGGLGYYQAMPNGQAPAPKNAPILGAMQAQPPPQGPQAAASLPTRGPLANVKLRLVVHYRTGSAEAYGATVHAGSKTYTDNGKVVGTATTGADGGFTFFFHEDLPTGMVAFQQAISWGSGEFGHNETGNLARFYRLEIDDGHFTNPSDELTLGANNTGTAGSLVALARFYRLTVRVKELCDGQNLAKGLCSGGVLPQVKVQLLRLLRPPAVPATEGDLNPHKQFSSGGGQLQFTFEVIGEKTASASGLVTFTRLVKNLGGTDQYYVRAFVDPTNTELNYAQATRTYKQSWGLDLSGTKPYDYAVYNEQYLTTLADTIEMKLTPLPPRYTGMLLRNDAKTQFVAPGWVTVYRVSSTTVDLGQLGQVSLPNIQIYTRKVLPWDKGHFSISDITPANNPKWQAVAGGPGFLQATETELPFTKLGIAHYHEFYLVPDGRVKGRVVDESGQAVHAEITVGAGPTFPTHPVFGTPGGAGKALAPQQLQLAPAQAQPQPQAQPPGQAQAQVKVGPPPLAQGGGQFGQIVALSVTGEVFDTLAPSTATRIIVNPGPLYFVDTAPISLKPGVNDLGTFTVTRRLHRLRLRVAAKTTTPGLAGGPAIPGAVVTVPVNGGMTATTNGQGVVQFSWPGTDSMVQVKIRGPDNTDYLFAAPTIKVRESRTFKDTTVTLELGTHVSGTVYAGVGDATPVAGAAVTVVGSGEMYEGLTGATDANGKYVIHRVPLGSQRLAAGKSKSNFIGDSATVDAKPPATEPVDFHLRFYEGMDISHLLGFPIAVYSLAEVPQGARISGAFLDVPGNSAFALGAPGPLAFDSIIIHPAGPSDKTAVPEGGVVRLTKNELYLDLFGAGKYQVRQRDGAGLQVRERDAGIGAVYGTVQLLSNSFAVTTQEIAWQTFSGDSSPVFLLKPGATGDARTVLPSLTADSAAPAGAEGFNLGAAAGGSAQFRLYQFRVNADSAGTFVKADAVHFKLTVHTDIPNVADLGIAVPDLQLVPGGGGGLKPVAADQTIVASLDQWKLVIGTWSIATGQIQLVKGQVEALAVKDKPASVVIFPFVGMKLTPTELSGGTFKADSIVLGGLIRMSSPGGVQFGREGPTGPWKLAGSGGELGALPGMRPTDKIELDGWALRSNGTTYFGPKDSAAVRFYNTADYVVKGLSLTAAGLTFSGNLDLHVPKLPTYSLSVFYTPGPGGKPVLTLQALNTPEIDIAGPLLQIQGGVLDSSGFHSGGTIRVANKFTVPIVFTRTPLTGTNQISAVPAPGAIIAVGDIHVDSLKGGGKVSAGQWATAFDGHLDVEGQAGGSLHLGVQGTDVAVGTAGIQVSNISTPFGNVTLTVNFPEQRFEGSLQIDKELSPGTSVKGAAELVFSGNPANRYWYFFAGANFTLSSPTLSGTAALLIGHATLSGSVLDQFNSYSAMGGVPPAFHTINGFFFEGEVVYPVPICPNIDVDVGVASVGVWCKVWGDVRLGMNFQEHNLYHIGAMMGAEVGAHGGVGVGICIDVSGKVDAQVSLEGEYRSDGAWYALGKGDVTLHGEVEYGVGLDDVCLENTAGFNIGIGMEAQKGYNWNTGQGDHVSIFFK